MSPNEFQLRAALHEGEGERPDPDLLISRALRVRDDRRRRIVTTLSAAAAVVAIGGGATLLVRTASSTSESAGGAGGAAQFSAPSRAEGRQPQSTNPSTGNQPAVNGVDSGAACPKQRPSLALPGGGGTNQFGASGPLFTSPVVFARVCLYESGDGLTRTRVLTGSSAAQLTSVLSSAAKQSRRCSTPIDGQEAAVLASSGDGNAEPIVTVQLSCPYRATNGTAVRYGNAALARLLAG